MGPLLSVLIIAFAVWFLFKVLGGGSDKAYRMGVKWGLQHPADSKGHTVGHSRLCRASSRRTVGGTC